MLATIKYDRCQACSSESHKGCRFGHPGNDRYAVKSPPARCLFGFGATQPRPIRYGAPIAALPNYKARVSSPFLPPLDCCAIGTPSISIHFTALSPLYRRAVDRFSPLFAPASYHLLYQSPLSTYCDRIRDVKCLVAYVEGVARVERAWWIQRTRLSAEPKGQRAIEFSTK